MKFVCIMILFLQSYPDYSPSLHRLLYSRLLKLAAANQLRYHGCCFIPD